MAHIVKYDLIKRLYDLVDLLLSQYSSVKPSQTKNVMPRHQLLQYQVLVSPQFKYDYNGWS